MIKSSMFVDVLADHLLNFLRKIFLNIRMTDMETNRTARAVSQLSNVFPKYVYCAGVFII